MAKINWYDRFNNTSVDFFMDNLGLTCGSPPMKQHLLMQINRSCNYQWAKMRPHYETLISAAHYVLNYTRSDMLMNCLNYEINGQYGFQFKLKSATIPQIYIYMSPIKSLYGHCKILGFGLPEQMRINPSTLSYSPPLFVDNWGEDQQLDATDKWLQAVHSTIKIGHMLSEELLLAARYSERRYVDYLQSTQQSYQKIIDQERKPDFRYLWLQALRPEAPYREHWLPPEPIITTKEMNKHLSAIAQQMICKKMDDIMMCRRHIEQGGEHVDPYHIDRYTLYT